MVLLKIAFYWLNASAYRSMAKMKAVAPKVTELRERYKDKPQEMQQEMMRIYREEKVNPLGGCLPIFVQMPFFIALYWVLLSSVEMRNAPWIRLDPDLSRQDPYFILPLLMTASSLFQVWLNPTPPDPMQARMMWIMPLVFSVMFFFFPAGLVLYWLTNNILSIAQQWFINKQARACWASRHSPQHGNPAIEGVTSSGRLRSIRCKRGHAISGLRAVLNSSGREPMQPAGPGVATPRAGDHAGLTRHAASTATRAPIHAQ